MKLKERERGGLFAQLETLLSNMIHEFMLFLSQNPHEPTSRLPLVYKYKVVNVKSGGSHRLFPLDENDPSVPFHIHILLFEIIVNALLLLQIMHGSPCSRFVYILLSIGICTFYDTRR
jgi:hypothetical protein